MKNNILTLLVILTCSFGFSQTGEQLASMGLNAGCTSQRSSNGNQGTYLSIMQSPAQTSSWKEAFDLGWRRCQSSKNWQIVNGRLVNVYKPSPYSTGPKKTNGDEPWVITVHETQGQENN